MNDVEITISADSAAVVIEFNKSVRWVELDPDDANKLAARLHVAANTAKAQRAERAAT